jgi:ubiquinone/menaquinone biosynthesis C-methylase UbiE
MSQDVQDFYNSNPEREWERLTRPLSSIEFASALRLIEKYFPNKGHVADIGGGPGRYTMELAKRGYQLTLIDISSELVRLAESKLKENDLRAELLVGDARHLSNITDKTFDAALFLGPMYHIIQHDERALALHELVRVLKPGGIAIISFINSWGLIRTGLNDFPNWYLDPDKIRSLLGARAFEGQQLSEFTECYWSTPESATKELEDAGLNIISYAGAQGFAGGMGTILERLANENPEILERVVQLAAEFSELKQFRDTTEHLFFVVRK